MSLQSLESARRWRLILGPNSEDSLSTSQTSDGCGNDLPVGGESGKSASGSGTGRPQSASSPSGANRQKLLGKTDSRRDQMLEYLYEQEYRQRSVGAGNCEDDEVGIILSRMGGKASHRLTAPEWLRQVRNLFPQSTAETLQKQALARYGMIELLSDPQVLKEAKPSMELVQALISCRSLLPAESMSAVRSIIRSVVGELERKLQQKIRNAIAGPRMKQQHGGRPGLANLDWASTIRRNLKHYDQTYDTVVLERLFFFQRNHRRVPWNITVVVDQSGSMLDSVIHSAVLAAIFTGVQSLRTRLVLFDTDVVDITDKTGDPVEVLLGVQLGGGTDIANAMAYAERTLENPRRSMVVLISDFYEGGDEKALIQTVDRLRQGGVTLLGLAALDDRAEPDYDHTLAQQLANAGMQIGAMTPEHLATWVGSKING